MACGDPAEDQTTTLLRDPICCHIVNSARHPHTSAADGRLHAEKWGCDLMRSARTIYCWQRAWVEGANDDLQVDRPSHELSATCGALADLPRDSPQAPRRLELAWLMTWVETACGGRRSRSQRQGDDNIASIALWANTSVELHIAPDNADNAHTQRRRFRCLPPPSGRCIRNATRHPESM